MTRCGNCGEPIAGDVYEVDGEPWDEPCALEELRRRQEAEREQAMIELEERYAEEVWEAEDLTWHYSLTDRDTGRVAARSSEGYADEAEALEGLSAEKASRL